MEVQQNRRTTIFVRGASIPLKKNLFFVGKHYRKQLRQVVGSQIKNGQLTLWLWV